MTKKIALTQGKVAIVDDEDFECLNKYKWYTRKDSRHTFYAARNSERVNGKSHTIRMHWHIVGKPEKPLTVDHINKNGLDNQRDNLRIISTRDNQCNRHNTKYYGAKRDGQRYRSQIRINGKRKYLGRFNTEVEAHERYVNFRSETGMPVEV